MFPLGISWTISHRRHLHPTVSGTPPLAPRRALLAPLAGQPPSYSDVFALTYWGLPAQRLHSALAFQSHFSGRNYSIWMIHQETECPTNLPLNGYCGSLRWWLHHFLAISIFSYFFVTQWQTIEVVSLPNTLPSSAFHRQLWILPSKFKLCMQSTLALIARIVSSDPNIILSFKSKPQTRCLLILLWEFEYS